LWGSSGLGAASAGGVVTEFGSFLVGLWLGKIGPRLGRETRDSGGVRDAACGPSARVTGPSRVA
jgi:hypothetical protein